MGMDNMIAAYVNEYGQDLANELTGGEIIVDGEILDEETQETGLAGENDGLDSSEEE